MTVSKDLYEKLARETNDFRILAEESRLQYIFDRLGEVLVKLEEIEKRMKK